MFSSTLASGALLSQCSSELSSAGVCKIYHYSNISIFSIQRGRHRRRHTKNAYNRHRKVVSNQLNEEISTKNWDFFDYLSIFCDKLTQTEEIYENSKQRFQIILLSTHQFYFYPNPSNPLKIQHMFKFMHDLDYISTKSRAGIAIIALLAASAVAVDVVWFIISIEHV